MKKETLKTQLSNMLLDSNISSEEFSAFCDKHRTALGDCSFEKCEKSINLIMEHAIEILNNIKKSAA